MYHKNNLNTRICVYALLDNAGGRTFVKEEEIETKAVDGLMASNFENIAASLAHPRTYVSQQIPASRNLATGNGARMASPAAG